MPAEPTTLVELDANLNESTAVGGTLRRGFSVYDGTGNADNQSDSRNVFFDFTKVATDAWDLSITGDNGTLTPSLAQPIRVTFDVAGKISQIGGQPLTGNTQLSINANWTSPAIQRAFGVDLRKMTQYTSTAGLRDLNVNGGPQGSLSSAAFTADGIVIGHYSNGKTRPLAKVAFGDVVNPKSLIPVSGTHFKLGQQTGDLTLYDPEKTTRAKLTPYALESSTADFGKEMTNLIVTQRAYSSAATAVRTVDEMSQIASNLKK